MTDKRWSLTCNQYDGAPYFVIVGTKTVMDGLFPSKTESRVKSRESRARKAAHIADNGNGRRTTDNGQRTTINYQRSIIN
jgi:hypothetical protein